MKKRIDILIIDDDSDVRAIVALALKLDSAIVSTAAPNPASALDILASSAPPDAILLDYSLPTMTGLQLLSEIRRIPSCEFTPVIFMTAMSDLDTRDRMVSAGAVGVIHKPFNPFGLASEVRFLAGL